MLAWTKNIHRRKLISNIVENILIDLASQLQQNKAYFGQCLKILEKVTFARSFLARNLLFLNGCLKVKNNSTKIKPMRLLW